MAEATIFVNEARYELPIQQIEDVLNELDGIERVLIDTGDGEIKVEFDDKKISTERIIATLQEYDYEVLS